MIINQSALKAVYIGFKSEFQNAFDGAPKHYDRLATTVPSTTKENAYPWLGQIPGLREWLGDRVIQNLKAHDYAIKNKKFEGTVSVPRDDIEDDNIGIFKPVVQEMGRAAGTHPDEMVFSLALDGFNRPCYDGQKLF